jgi:putative transcriptional regulator
MKTQSTKKRYMNDLDFGELMGSLKEVREHVRGERADLRVTRIALPAPPAPVGKSRIVKMRKRLNFSQAMFAKLLNVSPRTVQDWEQGRRTPSDAALKLLTVAEKHPEVLLEA